MTITQLTSSFSVSGELSEQSLAELIKNGVSTLINVRPNNEAAEQKNDAFWRNLCAKHGLEYIFIPVKPCQYSPQDIAKFKAALQNASKNVHAFCRTGTRASHLFALANKDRYGYNDIHSLLTSKGYDASVIANHYKEGA